MFIGQNLRGAGEVGDVEVFLVWFKVVVLVGLASRGLAQWDPAMLSRGVPDAGISAALFGAASVFMAYEGFQLLTYNYRDIDTPQKTLPRAVLSAIVLVIVVYVIVAWRHIKQPNASDSLTYTTDLLRYIISNRYQ